jgi:hypothetical protein
MRFRTALALSLRTFLVAINCFAAGSCCAASSGARYLSAE